MVEFSGTYDCTVDGKGRIIIPASLKRQLFLCSGNELILKRKLNTPCLELYEMEEWNRWVLMWKRKLKPFDTDHAAFKRAFFAGLQEVEMDSTGRILIAKDLLAHSGISKDVTMVAVGNLIEIWDKEKYEKNVAESERNLKELTQKVLGKFENPFD
jgi:MraZ protein